jgi:SAM-dependent methyltransferase
MEREPRRPRYSVFDLWAKTGITEHLGGIYATQELFKLSNIRPRQRILDVGCGTGFTACLLAQNFAAHITAIDIEPRILDLARRRIDEEEVGENVIATQSDVQKLPFDDNSFDRVLSESVMISTDPTRSIPEIFRVLKEHGVFGMNEMTFLSPPPRRLSNLLTDAVSGTTIQFLSEEGWKDTLKDAGFKGITSVVHKISPWQQFLSHMQIDGPEKFLSSLVKMITDPEIRSAVFDRRLIQETFEPMPYIGYGLYTGTKKP